MTVADGARFALFSDVHGNIRGLEACLEDLRLQGGADTIVGVGDYCMDGPEPRRVLERLASVGATCVRGNTDRYLSDVAGDEVGSDDDAALEWQRAKLGATWLRWLSERPFALRFGDGSGGLLVVHANPSSDDEHVWPDAGDALLERVTEGVAERTIAFGHLHLPYVRTWRDKLFVDVGSAGLPKDGDARAAYAILTQRSGGWQVKARRVPFDVDAVERDIARSGMPDAKKRITVLRRHRYKQLDERIP